MSNNKSTNTMATKSESGKKKNTRVLQSNCPSFSLEEAVKIPRAIKDHFAGQPTDPLMLAEACGYSPQSSTWRSLSGAAIAYGLTDGGYNSKTIGLTPLGERIVSPLIEGDDVAALREASLIPTVLKVFFDQYDRNRFPREDIAKNILIKNGVPQDRVESVYNIIRANGKFTNMIRVISGNEYVYASETRGTAPSVDKQVENSEEEDVEIPPELAKKMNIEPPFASSDSANNPVVAAEPRVYISHGKGSQIIVGQIKELLSYGQMIPVVSIENETTAISVPDKIFDDMRSCTACIIHICPESKIGTDSVMYSGLNENVLIEIGAAIALYGKKIIILCKKGTTLPSNLQGLYRCEYDSNQLDYTSTMKLLKTLQELRKLL